jgi:anti-sigma factor RsiW
MSCDQIPYLDAYLDGELPDADRRRVEQHLAACGECATELSRLRRLSAMIAGHRTPALSAAVLARIHDAVEAERPDLMILSLARRISAVAAAVVLAGSLYLTFFEAPQVTAASAPPPVWEQVAVSGVPEAQPVAPASAQAGGQVNTDQVQLAEWIVSDLGGRGGQQ